MSGLRLPKVFISYRRQDSAFTAGRLQGVLVAALGAESVFLDVDSIAPGDDFAAEIEREVAACDVLLAMIGPQWSTVRERDGRRRIDVPTDLVRLEIEAALRRGVRVVPVLVGGTMPDELSGELAGLARKQAVTLDPHRFEADARRLVDALLKSMRQDRPLIVPGVGVAGVELGAPEESIEAVLGPADGVARDDETAEVEYTYRDHGLQVYALDDVVGGFLVVGLREDGFVESAARTLDGVGAGSSRAAVETAFGAPDRLERAAGDDALDAARYLSRGIAFCYPPSSNRWSAPVAAVVVVPSEDDHCW